MSLIPGERPIVYAPSTGERGRVPFLGPGDIDLLAEADFGMDARLAASALFDAHRSPRLRRWVRQEIAVGWALDPQLRLLQLDAAFVDSRRARDCNRLIAQREFLAEAVGGGILADDLTSRRAVEIAENVLDLERSAWATALIVPALAHLDPSPRVLRNNLALLEAAIDYFSSEGLGSVSDDRGPFAKTRQLFAAICIHARLFRDSAYIRYLRDAYSEFSAHLYGYWVQVPQLTGGAPPAVIRGLSDFVYPLQDETETNVILDRIGSFGLGFLANGIAGDCMGTGAPEFITHPPTAYWPEPRSDEKSRGFALVAYNQVLLRNRQLTGPHGLRGQLAYRRYPCGECGHHPRNEPPTGNRAKKLHGFYWHGVQTQSVCSGSVPATQSRFVELLRRAEQANAELGEDGSYYAALWLTMRPDAAERFGES
jgi:hypothetical protein